MASADEWMSALSGFQMQPEHRTALAGHLSQTNVPAQHAQALSSIHVGSNQIPRGAGAVYKPADRSMHLSDPAGAERVGPGAAAKYRRTVTHEIGHAVSHHLNPDQFGKAMSTPGGRGALEAHAENYADQAMPDSYSGYDYEASRGRMPATYAQARGQRFGNIDPRLSGAA